VDELILALHSVSLTELSALCRIPNSIPRLAASSARIAALNPLFFKAIEGTFIDEQENLLKDT